MPPSQRTELPIPPELDDFVMSCLEKDPDKRPQSARELFEMACACGSAGWTNAHARALVGAHLPELTRDQPLTLATRRPHLTRTLA